MTTTTNTQWAGKWVNIPGGLQCVFVIGEYCKHWLIDASHEFQLIPLTTEFTPITDDQRIGHSRKLHDIDFERLEHKFKIGESAHGREAQWVHLQLWESVDRLMRARSSVRCFLQGMAREAIELLPDNNRRCNPFYLKEAKRYAEGFLNAKTELEAAEENHATWDNRWKRIPQHPRLPNYTELLEKVCVQR